MQHIGFVGASGWMGHGMAKNTRAKGFDVSMSVHEHTGFGSEIVPSLVKAQAPLNQVQIGKS